MSRVSRWSILALAAVACGGRAHSGDRGDDGIALHDAGAGSALDAAVPAPALPAPDGGRPDVEPACGGDGVVRHSVEVNRQEQLDELTGCTRIAGNLSVYERGFDLSPLLSLRVVEGLLWVDGEDGPRAGARRQVLDGFRALEQVGALTLLRVDVTNLAPLARLRRIGVDAAAPGEVDLGNGAAPGVLELTSCATFADFSGLDSLEQVDEIHLQFDPDLQRLSGMPRLQRLDRLSSSATPLRDLSGVGSFLERLDLTSTELVQLTGLGNASRLQTLTLARNRSLTSLEGGTVPSQMDAISIEDAGLVSLKGLEHLNQLGSLSLRSDPDRSRLETLSGLEGLVQVGSFSLQGVTRLSTLEGLRVLQRADNLFISDANALPTLAGLSSLTAVDNLSLSASALTALTGLGTLSVSNVNLSNILVASLAGFENVSVQGLYLFETPQLSTLNGLVPRGKLSDLSINQAPLLSDIDALSGVTELRGFGLTATAVANLDPLGALQKLSSLALVDNAQLSQIDAVRAVSGLVGLYVDGSPLLRALPSFDNVTGVGCADCGPFELAIFNNAALQTGPLLPALQQADRVNFANNAALTDLTGLSTLRAVDIIDIENNASLARVDLSALQSASSIRVRKNPALDDTPLARLRQLPRVSAKIVSNGSGPARLRPCPWLADGECDELTEDCAVGTDSFDCR